jgi:hypothetical protein
LTLYGLSKSCTIRYIFDEKHKGDFIGRLIPYIVSFNGKFDSDAEFHFYINGVEPELYEEPDENGKESDLYGKLIIEGKDALVGMPDHSSDCNLKNYLYNSVTEEKYYYYNALNTLVLMQIKKQATRYDVAFLNGLLNCLGETKEDN